MSKVTLDKSKLKNIVQFSYREFRTGKIQGQTKDQMISKIVNFIKKELK